jgi:hypothetical protein
MSVLNKARAAENFVLRLSYVKAAHPAAAIVESVGRKRCTRECIKAGAFRWSRPSDDFPSWLLAPGVFPVARPAG